MNKFWSLVITAVHVLATAGTAIWIPPSLDGCWLVRCFPCWLTWSFDYRLRLALAFMTLALFSSVIASYASSLKIWLNVGLLEALQLENLRVLDGSALVDILDLLASKIDFGNCCNARLFLSNIIGEGFNDANDGLVLLIWSLDLFLISSLLTGVRTSTTISKSRARC